MTDPAQMPRDPRDQAWLLWRKRLDGGDPLEVLAGWKPQLHRTDLTHLRDGLYDRLMGDPEAFSFNGGSGNWPWVAAAAKGDLAWAERAAAADLEHGIGRLEFGSPTYSPDRLLAQSALLAQDARSGERPLLPRLSELVRRQWLIHSLAMVPVAPHIINVYGHDGIEVRQGLDSTAAWYSGGTCTLPQTRVNADSMINGLLSYIVTKAMGAPCTYKRKADPSPESPYWPLYALGKIDHADLWPGRPFTWDEARQSDYRTAFRFSLYRTDVGTACWIGWQGESGIEPGPTTWKPTSLFNRVDHSGEQWIASPQRWARETDDRGWCHLDPNGKVHAAGRDADHFHDLPPGKPTLWLEFGPDGVRSVA